MEFSEKLQKLRKSRNMTQEELAGELYVSRTAVSKWESGRGYPSIDSLRSIASFFSVSVDDLLSGEKLIGIAEKENRKHIRSLCDLLLGITDIMTFAFIVLPLYPYRTDTYIYTTDLISYSQVTPFILVFHWILFILLFICGCIKIVLAIFKKEKGQKTFSVVSLILGIAAVFFLAAAKEPYATILMFSLLIVKSVIFFKSRSN